MTTADFPVLDAQRNNPTGRMVMDTFGFIDPYISETDTWCSMPLRLAHDPINGWHLELGPYDLDASDIRQLRAAIASYDKAIGQ